MDGSHPKNIDPRPKRRRDEEKFLVRPDEDHPDRGAGRGDPRSGGSGPVLWGELL